jgi:glutaredoxin
MSEIKVFTATGCATCMKVKDYLTKAGIEFTECNVIESRESAEELKRLGYSTVPVTICGDTCILGFDCKRLNELIASCELAAV